MRCRSHNIPLGGKLCRTFDRYIEERSMNPGRNDPCPCGSGRKYKKCCMNSATGTALRDISPIAISTRIAYAGRVGRERKKWCKDYIAWKTDQFDKMTADQAHRVLAIGKRISCSKGCWFCCSQHVGASLEECDAIVYWLHLHQDVREGFMARYPAWRSRLCEHEAVFQQVSQAGSVSMSRPHDLPAREEFMQKAENYGQLNVLCPFLDHGICSIYPVRPLVCATHVVVSPPDQCKSSSMEAPMLLLGATAPIQPPYFRGSPDTVIFSPAPLLVCEIINGGFIYLNDLPGLAGLENEAFGDLEILALLR